LSYRICLNVEYVLSNRQRCAGTGCFFNMNTINGVLAEVESYVARHNEYCRELGMLDEYAFNSKHIRTETWHRLRHHTPLFALSYRNIIYVVHDQLELLYIGETKKSLIERVHEHIQSVDWTMTGPWKETAEIQPKKIGYWLRELERYGARELFISILPIVELFGLHKPPGQLETIRRAMEGHLIDKLMPLCNGKGTVDVLTERYNRYCAWVTKCEKRSMLTPLCPDCTDGR